MKDYEYALRYPNHCPVCLGNGSVTFPGALVPYGSTTARLPNELEACPHCVGWGRCPRCGGELYDDEECIDCGWSPGTPGMKSDPYWSPI